MMDAGIKPEVDQAAAFDEREYCELRKHYFDPVVQHNVKLPGGRTLRKTTSPPRIEQKGRGYDALRKEIAELDKKKDVVAVWHLLRQLRAWEMRPPSLGGAALAGNSDAEVTETIDLTKEVNAIDADTYIIDVLLTKVVQIKRDPDGGEVRVSRAAPQPLPKSVKTEPTHEAPASEEPAPKRAKLPWCPVAELAIRVTVLKDEGEWEERYVEYKLDDKPRCDQEHVYKPPGDGKWFTLGPQDALNFGPSFHMKPGFEFAYDITEDGQIKYGEVVDELETYERDPVEPPGVAWSSMGGYVIRFAVRRGTAARSVQLKLEEARISLGDEEFLLSRCSRTPPQPPGGWSSGSDSEPEASAKPRRRPGGAKTSPSTHGAHYGWRLEYGFSAD